MPATTDGDRPRCVQCTKHESVSWPEFQALRHHHLLRDYPTRELLQEHLMSQSVDAENIQSVLVWRDGIADAWGNQFAYDDGRPMTLYDAWLHGASLTRQARERQREATPLQRPRPMSTATGIADTEALGIRVPRGHDAYGRLMGRLMQMSLRRVPRMTPSEMAAQCREWEREYPECQEALERAA